MPSSIHDYPARYGRLVIFFRTNPYWYKRMIYRFNSITVDNDTISLSTEFWSAICYHIYERVPEDKDDTIWDQLLVEDQQLNKFADLIRLGYFSNQKAP